MNAVYLVLAAIAGVAIYAALLRIFGRDNRMDRARERYNMSHSIDFDDCEV